MDAIAIGGASAVNSLSSSTSSTTITANRVALSNALDILNQLKIYRYTKYNSPIREDLARPTNEEGETEIGLIAQHVEATPELTHTVKTLPMFDDEVIAKKYPTIPVQETDWYIDNNEVTDEIKREKEKERIRIEKMSEQLKNKGGTFKTIILNGPKRYQCPKCKTITGELAPLYPEDTTLFSHNFDCQNRFKIPTEY